MPEVLKRILSLEESNKDVRTVLEQMNRGILRYESVFIVLITLCALGTTLFPVIPWKDMAPEIRLTYQVGLFLMCAASVFCHVMCTNLEKLSKKDSVVPTRMLLIAYTSALLIIAAVLTVIDFADTQSFFVYVIALVLIFGLLYIQPVITLVIVITYAAVLTFALSATGQAGAVSYVALYAYSFVTAVVSISNYHSRLRTTEASEMVRKVARHDSLTGVKNRHAIGEDAPYALGHKVYLLLGDIDDFKFYNDSFGHNTGDELLCAFAESMCQAFGEENVYRYGGDEFIALVFDAEEADFLGMVESWRSLFAGVKAEGERYVPTTSGGYVHGEPRNVEELQEMLRLADIRLYDAKLAGRNKVLGIEYEGGKTSAGLDAEAMRERRLGDSDALTGLPSMTYFLAHARSLLDSPTLEGATFYLVYFNIEDMKSYNERFGMAAGDELIAFAARAIQDAFKRALVTRVGDDRFALVTYNGDPIPEIRQVHEAVLAHKSGANTNIRAGVYEYEHGVEVSSACDFAKLACDHIKGRHNVYHYVYDENLQRARERTQFILDRFEEALENGHIRAYYQPIVRAMSGRTSEFEALARWIDPADGFVSPADFIPVLEEYRLVHMLDLKIVECVCKDVRDAYDQGLHPLPVNVNLSRYDMELCDIVNEIAQIMRRYDVPTDMLNIEFTESAFAENTELLRAAIEHFHDLGMQVWMDDFGSGYSSLNVLREFDFDVVKFDMFFLRHKNEASRERSRMMIPHLVSMAKELGLQTLTEGVETQDQYEFLRGVGCEKLQGYAFEKPIPIEDARELLEVGHANVEDPEERDYYNPIGQVDLATPYAIDPDLAHSIEMSGGLPAAIVEFREGRVGYLHWNSSYIDYLQDIGMNTIENSTAQMNDLSRPQSQGFFKAAEHLRGKQEWLNLSFYEGDDLCTGMARCVAVDEESGATAFLYIAFNVARYLARAGLTIPEQPVAMSRPTGAGSAEGSAGAQ